MSPLKLIFEFASLEFFRNLKVNQKGTAMRSRNSFIAKPIIPID